MPEFADINGIFATKRTMAPEEVVRAIKFAIASEFEAAQLYELIMESTDNEKVEMVLSEITEDERKHAGGLYKLLEILSPTDAAAMISGAEETKENLGIK